MATPEKKTFKDAFASAGPLVRQYKPFILKQAKKYAHKYRVPRRDMIAKAVEIAIQREPKFDPGRGKAFPSYLEPWLRGLNRYGKRQYRLNNGIMSPRQKLALGLVKEKPLEKWEKEKRERERKKEAERKRLVGWGNRRPDEMARFGLEITDYRYGQFRGDGGNYRTWKAGIGPNSVARLDEAAEEIIRHRRLTKKQRAMLDWMMGNLAGREVAPWRRQHLMRE
jgi:hypothetical protein